jgi:hypothetical protein
MALKITNEDNMELMLSWQLLWFSKVDPPYGIDAGKMTMGSKSNLKKKVKIGIVHLMLFWRTSKSFKGANHLGNYLNYHKITIGLYGIN